jgi:hypothetical protein
VKFVKLGVISRSQDHSTTITFGITERIKHEGFNGRTMNQDIALLKLDATVQLSEFIMPICMPTREHRDDLAIVTGFGKTEYNQAVSEHLMKVSVEHFTHEECKETWPSATNDTMLCYGDHNEIKDSCGVR